MKKIVSFLIILSVFITTSCTSISDLFSKNKEETSTQTAPEVINEKPSDNENNPIIEEPVLTLQEPADNQKKSENDTLQDLINTTPEDFKEPLVRDLELTDDEKSEIAQNINSSEDSEKSILEPVVNTSEEEKESEKNVIPEPVKNTEEIKAANNKNTAKETTSPEEETQNVEPKITVVKNDEPVKKSETKHDLSKPVENKPVETKSTETKLSTPETETNKTSEAELKENKSPESESESKSVETKVPENLENEEKKEETKSQNIEPEITEQKEPQQKDDKIIEKEEIKKETEETKTVEPEKKSTVSEPPATSAGTKTENKDPVIPSKSETTGSSNKKTEPVKTEPVTETKKQQIPEEVISEDTKPFENSQESAVKTPTRSVTLNKGETLIVEYPGSGWIYLGSEEEYNNLESKGRKSGTNTTYTLTAIAPGTQIQHFYKTDSVSGKYIDDYIEVTVTDKKGFPSTVVYAPKYEEIVPKKPEKPALSSDKITKPDVTIPVEASKTEVDSVAKTGERQSVEYTPEDPNYKKQDDYTEKYDNPKPVTPAGDDKNVTDLYEQAKKLYDEKQYSESLKVINTYLDYAVSNRDKGLYLKAKILESDGPAKNIKEAIKTYRFLQDNYPASEYWDEANKRIIYLKRFYIEAR